MRLLWIKYKTKKGKYNTALFLHLGREGKKVHMLKSSNLGAGEVAMIRKYLNKLQSMPLAGRVSWLRDHIPGGFKSAYRTLNQEQIHLMGNYEPQELI